MYKFGEIKRYVSLLVDEFGTNDPFKLAELLNIQIFWCQLGKLAGYYKYMKKHRCIFINSDIEDEHFLRLVMAHELGHAILHRSENCYFIKNKTLLLTSKYEREANKFSAELLIPDGVIEEYEGYTERQIASILCVDIELLRLKANS